MEGPAPSGPYRPERSDGLWVPTPSQILSICANISSAMLLNTNQPATRPFIVLEGLNGAGKSTLQRALAEKLSASGQKICLTHEPGGTALGQTIRGIVLEHKHGALSPECELLLFAADRAQHVSTVIAPALARNELVICDRFTYSTVAFQGYGRGLDRQMIEQINNAAIGQTRPALVILLDIEPRLGLKRIAKQPRNDRDAFEAEELAFHERVRQGFLDQARNAPEPFIIIDASKPADELLQTALSALSKVGIR